MAKSTRAQEVSTGTPDSYTPAELNDPSPPLRIRRAMLGVVPQEVSPSVGMDYSPSSQSEPMKNVGENLFLPPPAPTTENHSGQTGKVDSDVDSTGGDGRVETEPPQSDEKPVVARKAAKKSQARVRSTGDDDFDF